MVTESEETAAPLGEALARALRRRLGEAVEVDSVAPLSGGASREILALDARVDGQARRLVLRRDPPGRAESSRQHEFELIAAAHRHGVPVPEPLFALDGDDGLGAGFLMARIDGETLGPRILHSEELAGARAELTGQCAAALARIHAIPAGEAGFLDGWEQTDPAAAQLERWAEILHGFEEPHPALEWALLRLRRIAPEPGPVTVVHGDFRNGNLVVGPDGLRAVLDWELSHAGDPMEDLGWLCVRAWRFSEPQSPVGGFGRREELFAAYEAAGGGPVDAERVRFWEIFGNFKWAVICMMQAGAHLSGEQPSLELAAIGRRTCEPEWELLAMLGEGS